MHGGVRAPCCWLGNEPVALVRCPLLLSLSSNSAATLSCSRSSGVPLNRRQLPRQVFVFLAAERISDRAAAPRPSLRLVGGLRPGSLMIGSTREFRNATVGADVIEMARDNSIFTTWAEREPA